MRAFRKCSRILILCLLLVSASVFLLSHRLKFHSDASRDFVEDLSILKHRTEAQSLSAIEQEESGSLKEPALVVYKDDTSDSAVRFSSIEDTGFDEVRNAPRDANLLEYNATRHVTNEGNPRREQEEQLPVPGVKEESHADKVKPDQVVPVQSRRTPDERVKEMKDQLIRAKAYLNFTPANSTSHLVKELKLRIKEVQKAITQSSKGRVSKSSLQKMRAMESTLSKAKRVYPDCASMIKKLRAMTYNAEEQVRLYKNQETFLRALGGRTIPKGLHCLSMRLTAEYFALEPEKRELLHKDKLNNPHLYHYAIFSDNILACSVVVNSTVSTAEEPQRIVFHIVTNSLNHPAMSMWFLANPPYKAAVHVENIENFQWLSTKYNITLQKEGSVDPRYNSELNHLRFYLPDVYPRLNKIVLLDHDVVVQKDLSRLWSTKMQGKVNGAVLTCKEGEPSYRRMDMFVNFTDPIIANKFDAKACTWAFGMNLFDLHEWRRRNLTGVYHKYLHLGNKRPLMAAGSLPIGWLTFYKNTVALDKSWHVPGLGHYSNVRQEDIDRAAVLHFEGLLKPWLDIAIDKYKHIWREHVKYEHPYLQQCNVHE